MRTRIMLGVVTFVCAALLVPSLALAGTWTPLVPPSSVTGTLTISPPPPFSTVSPVASAGFAIPLHRGESLTATLATGSGVTGVDFRVTTSASDYSIVADPPVASTSVLHFASEASQTAWLMISSSTPGTFTLDVGQSAPLPIHLGALHAPCRASRKRAFWVDAKLSDYDGFASPVRFMIDRKVRGHWRGFSSAVGGDDVPGESWHYYAKLRLPRGTFRVRARFKDAAHPVALYDGWKNVVVR